MHQFLTYFLKSRHTRNGIVSEYGVVDVDLERIRERMLNEIMTKATNSDSLRTTKSESALYK